MLRSKVVFPQPLGPRRVKNSPVLISRLTFFTASKFPNLLLTLTIRMLTFPLD